MPTIGSILNPLRQKCPDIRYFRWDKNKARANIRKHGIDFDTASLLFRDPFSVRKLDRITAEGEILWHTFGMVQGNMLLIVTHTTTDEDGNEYVRIISARRTTRQEKRFYFSKNRERGNM